MKRFEVGSRVVEPTYGLGSIAAIEDAYLRVEFDEHGSKKFLSSLVRLEHSDEPPPAGSKVKRARKTRKTATTKTVRKTKTAKAKAE